MKTVRLALLCISLIIIVLMFVGISYARIDPKTIVGIWLFDEGTGDLAKDASGNGLDGKILGDVKWDKGKFGDAINLDGVNDYVDLGTDERLKPQRITIVAWFSTRKLNAYGHIFQSGNDWNDIAGIVFRVHQDGYSQAAITQGPGNTAAWLNGPILKAEEWYHAALTFDGTTALLYINGDNVANAGGAKILYDQWPARIGSHSHSVSSLFNGMIDDFALFNEAISQDDIMTIMDEGLEKALGITAVSPAGKLTTTWGTLKIND